MDLRLVDLSDVLLAVVTDLTPLADLAGVRFIGAYAPVQVRADPGRLTQFLTNLLTNAINHAPTGSTIEATVREENGSAVAFVTDEGPGFREEDRQRLFVPFWRAGINKAAGRLGSGLGLALAAKLAEAQDGHLIAENRPDRSGAVFSLWLPIAGALNPPSFPNLHA